MDLIKKGLKNGNIIIDKKANKVTYLPQGKTRSLKNPEEKVQLDTFLRLIYEYKYPAKRVRVCVPVKMGSATKEADVVVFKDDDAKTPFIIVECKKQGVSERVFKGSIDQGFSYAASTNAKYVWATSLKRNAHFKVFHDAINEREKNKIKRIPKYTEIGGFLGGRTLIKNPILLDAMVYSLILFLCTAVLSLVAVQKNPMDMAVFNDLKLKGMNYNWIYNGIVAISTIVSLIFGFIFMRGHKLFATSGPKWITHAFVALLLFLPAWYAGIINKDPMWWSVQHFTELKMKAGIYLWPYLKAIPFQFILTSALIWLLTRRE